MGGIIPTHMEGIQYHPSSFKHASGTTYTPPPATLPMFQAFRNNLLTEVDLFYGRVMYAVANNTNVWKRYVIII